MLLAQILNDKDRIRIAVDHAVSSRLARPLCAHYHITTRARDRTRQIQQRNHTGPGTEKPVN